MFLWTSFFIVFGIFGVQAGCPKDQAIYPCTCKIIRDKFGEEFEILRCESLHSQDALDQLLWAIRGEKLFELQLVNCSLSYIPHDAFHDSVFQVIKFENSNISALSNAHLAFEGLEKTLRLLDIVNCSFLSNWDWAQLAHLKDLMEVVVMHSDLPGIVDGLSIVEDLDFQAFVLKNSNIEWLDKRAFAPFMSLARITMDRNQIEHLERTMFPKPANHLKILDFSYNRLSRLPEDLFVDMPSLSSVYFTGNPLKIIDENVFKHVWNQIAILFFHDTRLSCDCRLAWITKTDNSQKYVNASCHSPERTKDRQVVTLQSYELLC